MIIREAKQGDEVAIMELVHGLAIYEKAGHEVENTAEKLREDLFDAQRCEALIAENDSGVIAFALFYTSYSTWKGPCIYLEDLFVEASERRSGAGGALFDRLVEITKERGYKRLDWQVLDWNQLAIDFYKKRGAELDAEWINGRISF